MGQGGARVEGEAGIAKVPAQAACRARREGVPCSIPAALMSSSISGQCTPWPEPMISNRWRCAAEASESRHDHARGTLMTRPSARRAVIDSSSTVTNMIRGSLIAAVFIPCLQNQLQILNDYRTDPVQLARSKPVVVPKSYRTEPEFAHHALALYMDVHRLAAIETVEKNAIRTADSLDARHFRCQPEVCPSSC